MPNLADSIEAYLLYLLEQTLQDNITVQRSSLAEKFRCAPSQINYVLDKRFSLDRGFLVRSRRGGGGHIMIVRLPGGTTADLLRQVISLVDPGVSQERAEALILRLEESGVITRREAALMHSAVQREHYHLPLPDRDLVRAGQLGAMLEALLWCCGEEE